MKTIFSGIYNPVPRSVFENDSPTQALDEYIAKAETEENQAWANEMVERIVKKLESLEIKGECSKITVGATTTTVYLTPAANVRMSKFKNIEDDISVAVGAKCRVIAPIPNTTFVGVEIPTKNKQVVDFGSVYGGGVHDDMELPISMGVMPNGEVLGFDLAKMPHLLIAGASGQGKSVGLNVIIMSLLSTMHPRDLNLYLIDPKRVEFSAYETLWLTRILKRIDTELHEAEETLGELCEEMDRRYSLMKNAGARKISDYNKTADETLPYIVTVIDEFADLMMSADSREVERNIIRIAQLGRAAGIHLIIATQRPDANIITGLIKANFPARIAFKTASSVDSKIILDTTGAQQLVGNGDMLMMVNGETQRAQCAYISDEEIQDAVYYCIQQLDTMTVTEEVPAREETLADVLKEAINPTTAPEKLTALASHSLPHVRRSVAKNISTPVDTLRLLCFDEDQSVRYNVAVNPSATDDIIKTLRRDHNEDIRRAAHRHIQSNTMSTTEKQEYGGIEGVLIDADLAELVSIASDPATPSAVLTSLACGSNIEVRKAVAANPSTPASLLSGVLIHDYYPEVAVIAAKRLK